MSWGFATLLVKKGVDIVLPLTHWKGCLQTINQFIFVIHSHYFSLFAFYLHLPSTCTSPTPPVFSLTYSPFFSLLLSLSQTRVCSPSIIFNTPFPEHRCMPELETKRLWYEPGCVGRASYLHVGFNSFSVRRERIGVIMTIQAFPHCSVRLPSLASCIWVLGCVSIP